MGEARLVVVAGPARSGIAALAGAVAAALERPERDGSAALARLHLVAEAARQGAARFADLGLAPPGPLVTPGMAEALLADLFAGAGDTLVLRAAETLPRAAVLPGLRHLLPLLPDARVLLLQRHALETVCSRLRSLPRMPFAAHCLAWSAAMAAGRALAEEAPGQVLAVGQEEMLTRPGPLSDRLGAFLGLDAAASVRVLAHLRAHRPAGSGLDEGDGPPGLERLGWSTPEKALFLDLCGPAMAEAGQSVGSLAEAVRRAPLHLAELARDGALRLSGLRLQHPPEAPPGTLRLRAAGAGPAIAVFPAIAPAGRNRLRLRLSGLAANGAGARARVEAVGTLSRGLLLAEDVALPAGGVAELDRALYNPPTMMDLVISMIEGHEAGGGLDLHDPVLVRGPGREREAQEREAQEREARNGR
ncbi:hypothetical protein EAH89_04475 [Roseomonas nepalensis]|uniref:Sulfotransferase n=1 Tax=Muricoccus nepalensis TaxID=1854500 RepID=A0A502GFE9_9PROT|nr:sulfotransferase [Roseomonas nepalensis]TPG60614.1 hypothetical protein EAH89_04475 [Roseomonas nepalensis]